MTQLVQGDVLVELAKLAEQSFDAVLTDPPYGLHFLGEGWDGPDIKAACQQVAAQENAGPHSSSCGGLPAYQHWCALWGGELLRAVKPGGYLLAFGHPRTYHRLTSGLEDAGWIIRDSILWLYGGGFPKSLNLAKALDQYLGVPRRVIGQRNEVGTCPRGHGFNRQFKATADGSASAKRWAGYGTNLKPAYEPIVVAMKPCEGSYAENALLHGVSGLNVGGCRIGWDRRPMTRTAHTTSTVNGHSCHQGQWAKLGKDAFPRTLFLVMMTSAERRLATRTA